MLQWFDNNKVDNKIGPNGSARIGPKMDEHPAGRKRRPDNRLLPLLPGVLDNPLPQRQQKILHPHERGGFKILPVRSWSSPEPKLLSSRNLSDYYDVLYNGGFFGACGECVGTGLCR